MNFNRSKMFGDQDDCLIAITDDKPEMFWRFIRELPPWRAVLIARVAVKTGLVSQQDVDMLVGEARMIGGSGNLDDVRKAHDERRR